jgi:hypothetical protein
VDAERRGGAACAVSPGASYAQAVFWLLFIPAFLAFGSALFVINEKRLKRLGRDRRWDMLVALSRLAQAGLVLLFVATVASMLTSQVSTQDRAVAVWLAAAGTALHYSVQQARDPRASRG